MGTGVKNILMKNILILSLPCFSLRMLLSSLRLFIFVSLCSSHLSPVFVQSSCVCFLEYSINKSRPNENAASTSTIAYAPISLRSSSAR